MPSGCHTRPGVLVQPGGAWGGAGGKFLVAFPEGQYQSSAGKFRPTLTTGVHQAKMRWTAEAGVGSVLKEVRGRLAIRAEYGQNMKGSKDANIQDNHVWFSRLCTVPKNPADGLGS